MRIRSCTSKIDDRHAYPVKTLKSFKQDKRSFTRTNGNSSKISQISFIDFLPKSITKSPQRNANSHTRTTQRLGLCKANRIGAIELEDTSGGSLEFNLTAVPQTAHSMGQSSVMSAGNYHMKQEPRSVSHSAAMMSQELTAATKNALQQLCTYSHVEESAYARSPSK